MADFEIVFKNEENFFLKIRKIVKEELTNSKGYKQENKSSIPYIKADEVMLLLQISRPTLDDWVEKGFFKKYKVNSRTFFNRDEIIEFLSKQGK